MDGLIIGFITGYLVKVLIAICFDEYQLNKELREAKIKVELDKCCENAYNCGYEKGRLEERAKWEKHKQEMWERWQVINATYEEIHVEEKGTE